MNAILRIDDVVEHDGEPTLKDLRLAQALGYDRPHEIRRLIQRNMDELQRYGEVCATMSQTEAENVGGFRHDNENPRKGGRPGIEFLLNEGQALLVSVKSDARNAADVREQLIRVFMAWRRGRLLPPDPAEPMVELGLRYAPLGAKVEFLRWIERVRGREAALAYFEHLGLPPLPATLPAAHGPAPQDVLAAILNAGDGPVLVQLEEARDGDPAAIAALDAFGIRVEHAGFWISNLSPGAATLFDGTALRDGRWIAALRRLPGASYAAADNLRRVAAGRQSRGTWLPWSVLT